MKEQLYKVVPLGQPLEKSDLSFILGEKRLTSAEEAMVVGYESNGRWIRPVSTETATGSAEEIEEVFRHGLSPVYAEIREAERLKLLREQYAGLAMQGILAHPGDGDFKVMADMAVTAADALIAALNKKEEQV